MRLWAFGFFPAFADPGKGRGCLGWAERAGSELSGFQKASPLFRPVVCAECHVQICLGVHNLGGGLIILAFLVPYARIGSDRLLLVPQPTPH